MNRKIFWAVILVSVVAFGGIFTRDVRAEYGDIMLDRKIDSMRKANVKPVVFPHWFHRIRFKCKVCHEDIFIIKKGANDINMKAIMEGKFCGKCHNGLVAWEPLYCDRCHSYKGR